MDNAAWVAARLAALPGHTPFADGERLHLHGMAHRIRHAGELRGPAWVEGREIVVPGERRMIARRVTELLRDVALQRFEHLVAHKADMARVAATRVSVKDTRSRWGSCAANGNLAFSWRLVMAPRFVQDYVAAHEVAHLRHMNHGPRFWSLLEQLTPHGALAMAWLRDNGPMLLRVG